MRDEEFLGPECRKRGWWKFHQTVNIKPIEIGQSLVWCAAVYSNCCLASLLPLPMANELLQVHLCYNCHHTHLRGCIFPPCPCSRKTQKDTGQKNRLEIQWLVVRVKGKFILFAKKKACYLFLCNFSPVLPPGRLNKLTKRTQREKQNFTLLTWEKLVFFLFMYRPGIWCGRDERKKGCRDAGYIIDDQCTALIMAALTLALRYRRDPSLPSSSCLPLADAAGPCPREREKSSLHPVDATVSAVTVSTKDTHIPSSGLGTLKSEHGNAFLVPFRRISLSERKAKDERDTTLKTKDSRNTRHKHKHTHTHRVTICKYQGDCCTEVSVSRAD